MEIYLKKTYVDHVGTSMFQEVSKRLVNGLYGYTTSIP